MQTLIKNPIKIGDSLEGHDFSGQDLSGVDFRGSYLKKANFSGCNLSRANFDGVDLIEANLRGANLSKASLDKTDFMGADLTNADLSGTDLSTANLRFTTQSSTTMPAKPVILPNKGESVIGYKKLSAGAIIKVEVPADAERLSTHKSKKCRASALLTLEVIKEPRSGELMSGFVTYKHSRYAAGEITLPDGFNSDDTEQCAPGLHFFLTLQEAEDFGN